MTDNFDGDDERKQLEHLSDEELERMARDYDLLPDGVTLEDKSTEFVDGLIGEIIAAKAYSDSQDAEWNEQQDIIEQQRRDAGY
ncbi:hypothetical protein LZ654_17580 [Lelliottia amnigena]|jgi:hypothetical protein|uniref:hypothetical protein n=1 Tax=Lelliottia amnigena TaxID=61646 RepID=UPI001F15D3A4|nr:hypothetical protein [Lelliottia amnigena]MCE9966634.1 hypothetical protein [Lelliottia amnigena]